MNELRKTLRTNSRFLADLYMAEASLLPLVNDWEHLSSTEVKKMRECLDTLRDLQQEARDYEDYLKYQIRDSAQVC